MNILIAEDEKLLSKVLREEFEEAGFKVSQAFNGLEVLKELKTKSKNIDLVLLDLLMPVVDGFQVLEEIQKDQLYNLSSIPVIVLSNLGQDDEIKKAFKLGAQDYFVKSQHPISEVVEKVKTFLEKPRAVSFKKEKVISEVVEEGIETKAENKNDDESERAQKVKEADEYYAKHVKKLKVKSED